MNNKIMFLSESEKERILNLHKSATRNGFLLNENQNNFKIDNPQQYGLILIKDNGQLLPQYQQYSKKTAGAVYEPDYDYILLSSDGTKTYACQYVNVGAMGPSCYSSNNRNIVGKTTEIEKAKSNIISSTKTQQTQTTTQQTTDKPKDIKGFQIWLNKNVPTWYKGGKLTTGFGVFGPKTAAAWGQYKKTYILNGGK
jgi:hypothetical protein